MRGRHPATILLSMLYPVIFAAEGTSENNAEEEAFCLAGQNLIYRGSAFSARADGRGWISLKVRADEFLSHGDSWAGIGFRREDAWILRFPSASIVSHDEWKGRQGIVGDGLFMVRLRPGARADEMEWYGGFNDPRPHDWVFWLHDDVWMIRSGDPTVERWKLPIERPESSSTDQMLRHLWLVHRSGRALGIAASCRIATLLAPDGIRRRAVIIPCRGFEANTARGIVDPQERDDYFLSSIVLEVDSRWNHYGGSAALPVGVRSAIYELGEDVDMALRFQWWGPRPFSGTAVLEIRHALGSVETFEKHSVHAEAAPRGEGVPVRVHFAPRLRTPGISDVWCRLMDREGRVVWIEHFRAAYAIEQYTPQNHPPEDLRMFWDQTLADLRSRPLNAVEEPIAAVTDHPLFHIRQISFDSLDGKRMWALLFVPREGTPPYPAIVTAHPASRGLSVRRRPDGTYGSQLPARLGFVTIQPLVRGHPPDAPDIPFNHPWWGDLQDRDTFAARHWYAAMVRAVDYLISRPDLVDPKRIAAKGGSQGGALAIALAALDPRIAFCFADSPSHGQLHEMLEGRYESFGPSPGRIPPDRTLEETRQLLSYFDPVNLAPWVRCPTYLGFHIGDLTVHAMSGLSIYRNLTGLQADQKKLFVAPGHLHAAPRGYREAMDQILDRWQIEADGPVRGE